MTPTAALGQSAASAIDAESYRFLQGYIYRESGIVLDSDKHFLLIARLAPILKQEKLSSVADLCEAVKATRPSIRQKVVEALTTHETTFFRDAAHFGAVKAVVPELLDRARRAGGKLRIWSAACSSGQEPYSLAMLLLEAGLRESDFSIVGTDLSERILERARAATYTQFEVGRGLPAPLLVRHFTKSNMEWRLVDDVRRSVRFEKFDLRQSPAALGSFHLILCRNVMIYFDLETKRRILGQLKSTLVCGGYLLLGSAETTINLDDSFVRTKIGHAVIYQRP